MFVRQSFPSLAAHFSSRPGYPLLILGAVATGKTTLVKQYSAGFSSFISVDLDTAADRKIFGHGLPFDETLKALFFLKGKDLRHKRTLIFLREVQQCPEALEWLSQAGSQNLPYQIAASASVRTPALDDTMERNQAGVLHLRPFNFGEYLLSTGDEPALEAFREVPVPVYAYEKLLHHFHLYSLVGGMPAVIARYAASRNLSALRPVYEEILAAMTARIRQHARGAKHGDLLASTLQNAFPYAATRIKFNGFANTGHRSREIGEAFRTLERFMLLQLVYPTTSTDHVTLPAADGHDRSPRLQLPDTGLVNYFSGIQKPLFRSHDMNAIFEGQIARQVVGQEILAAEGGAAPILSTGGEILPAALPSLSFWTRASAQSTAEVDFVIPHDGLLIPVVVRSGEPGRLRSLHQFVDAAPHAYAVRLHAGRLSVAQVQTIRGKKFFLLNLPYFLAGKIRDHLKGFIRLANG